MPKLSPQQLREIYLKLPQDLKDAIFSMDSANTILSVGNKYKLIPNKISELADEVGLVMLGLTASGDFVANLVKRLEVDEATAGKISEEINSQIFSKVKESMEKIHGKESQISNLKSQINFEKTEILQEIERDHAAEMAETQNIEPPKVIYYPAGDPYREPTK